MTVEVLEEGSKYLLGIVEIVMECYTRNMILF